MKTIALEEHFVTRDFLQATNAYGESAPPAMQAIRERLLDLGEGRVAAMDEGGVDVQVLSLAAMGVDDLPAAEQTTVLKDVHNELADAVRARPERFAAFASPGLKDPAAAARELERCVKELGFVGALFDGTTDGKFLDAPEFLPVFEAAESLGVPIYLHPAPPPQAIKDVYYSGLPGDVGYLLSIAGWGWHAENGLHILRLIVAGVLDRFPKLQIIIGHMGEGVPYALARSSNVLTPAAKLKRSVAETFLAQVHVTTSGYFTRPPFECARQVVGLDHLMYSVDYPFSPNTRGKEFLASLQLEEDEMTKLTYANAERVLKL